MIELYNELKKYIIPPLANECLKYYTYIRRGSRILVLSLYICCENYVGSGKIINDSDRYFKQRLIDNYCDLNDIKAMKFIDNFIKNEDNIDWKWPYMVACNQDDSKQYEEIKKYIQNKADESNIILGSF
jgi:hypothetical protein